MRCFSLALVCRVGAFARARPSSASWRASWGRAFKRYRALVADRFGFGKGATRPFFICPALSRKQARLVGPRQIEDSTYPQTESAWHSALVRNKILGPTLSNGRKAKQTLTRNGQNLSGKLTLRLNIARLVPVMEAP